MESMCVRRASRKPRGRPRAWAGASPTAPHDLRSPGLPADPYLKDRYPWESPCEEPRSSPSWSARASRGVVQQPAILRPSASAAHRRAGTAPARGADLPSTGSRRPGALPSSLLITSIAYRQDWSPRRPGRAHRDGHRLPLGRPGHVVTNYHLIEQAQELAVTLATTAPTGRGGRARAGRRISPSCGSSTRRPAQADSPGRQLDLQVGQRVLAIGNPWDSTPDPHHRWQSRPWAGRSRAPPGGGSPA